jgi:FMN phosphatase YigB (HAD superfamily)
MQEFLVSDMKDIKVIIFDFDETMYYSSTIRDFYINFIKKTIMTLSSKSEEETLILMKEVGFTKENKASPSFSSSCGRFGITKQQWDDYRIDNFFEIDYATAEVIDGKLLKNLSEKFPLYIVTNEIYKNLLIKAKNMNINLDFFKKLYAPSPEQLGNYFTKKQIYEEIIKNEGVKSNEVLVIGDRIKVDVNPVLELGGNGLIVKHPNEIKEFFDKHIQVKKTSK